MAAHPGRVAGRNVRIPGAFPIAEQTGRGKISNHRREDVDRRPIEAGRPAEAGRKETIHFGGTNSGESTSLTCDLSSLFVRLSSACGSQRRPSGHPIF